MTGTVMARKRKMNARKNLALPDDYPQFLATLKRRVRQAQTRAALSASRELIALYWDIGREIVLRQEQEGWGKSVVDRLARDIQAAFPGIKGFSPVNVWRMRAFFLAWRDDSREIAQPVREISEAPSGPADGGSILSQAVTESGERAPRSGNLSPLVTDSSGPPEPIASIPWGHNQVLLFKLKNPATRLWYAAKALEHGWSRTVLTAQIESDLYGRQGQAVSNFTTTLPPPQSDLARQSLKDPYLFDFLTLGEDAAERDLESGLVDHIQRFLIELGAGFAFVGRQVHLDVGDDDFYIDLLFYHLQLRCFVVIDLKMRKFAPEDAGKMNFYLSAVDTQMRHRDDAPSIGLVLCKERDRITAEYALRDMAKPIGVAQWQMRLVQSLPASLKGQLPSIDEIEQELSHLENRSPSASRRKDAKQEKSTHT